MVHRKPVPANASINHLPYPVSPTSTQPHLASYNGFSNDDEIASESVWASEQHYAIPASLQPGSGRLATSTSQQHLTSDMLSIGAAQDTPRILNEQERARTSSTNPFHTTIDHVESNPWQPKTMLQPSMPDLPPPPSAPAPPPPPFTLLQHGAPNEKFSGLTLNEPSSNPWRTAAHDKVEADQPSRSSALQREESGNASRAPASIPPARLAPPAPYLETESLITFDEDDASPAWDEEISPTVEELPVLKEPHISNSQPENTVWEDAALQRELQESSRTIVADDEGKLPDRPKLPVRPIANQDVYPESPASAADALPPPQPPRPSSNGQSRSTTLPFDKNKESYGIKQIRWKDISSLRNSRLSPILVRNLNGPCPLLALVNALVLSTPGDLSTPLVQALRSREQISLLLLLDAVIDELIRRMGPERELPDIIELHSFLLDLHTGMNVNPRFVSNDGHAGGPGSFEKTRQVSLYNGFSIPLVHGWLPSRYSPEAQALERSARSYEDVQNLQFREEELEEKLRGVGLGFQEQGVYEDILTIKTFLETSSTQLTSYGISILLSSIPPNSFCVLFRNNHFSTLYHHEGMLFSLVTDQGYATHEEVVWEALADTSGELCEFYSGDFRIVGDVPPSPDVETSDTHRRVQYQPSGNSTAMTNDPASTNQGPTSPNTEQEDHDLALALQLQDEEDRLHREEQDRRRREAQLSEQFLGRQPGQQGQRSPPVTTGRRQTMTNPVSANLRPAIPPRRNNVVVSRPTDPEAGIDQPPPSYEQAATSPVYEPPAGSPIYAGSNAGGAHRNGRSSSAYMPDPTVPSNGQQAGRPLVDRIPSRRTTQSQGLTAQQQEERSKECIVM